MRCHSARTPAASQPGHPFGKEPIRASRLCNSKGHGARQTTSAIETIETTDMIEKTIGVALMAAIVWSAFHFFGDIDDGPRAVVALAPVAETTQIVELGFPMLP